ncbi:PQQ-binding-like beta-propeller repeat protein [Salinispira pacifica]|uniref:outer membrane protein assembly factor BamB family protein n=1 Tax=Salinispira pacifica TaxID=1307761 RepID=UPI0011836BBE|nr:PQQ-binding-like beta-propeller repeat protein [Salinispira pacifica]
MLQNIQTNIRETLSTLNEQAPALEPISEEQRELLEKTERRNFIRIFGAETAEASDPGVLIPVVISASPAGSVIFIDGERRGVNSLSLLSDPGSEIRIEVRADGFESFVQDLMLGDEQGISLNVSLESSPQATDTGASDDSDSPANPEQDSENADTDETAGETTGGQQAATDDPEETPETEAAQETARTANVGDAPGESSGENNEPLALGALQIKVSDSPISTALVSDGVRVYAADQNGTVYALDSEGRLIWRTPTGNRSNNRNLLVVSQNDLYFQGTEELLLLSARDGSIIARRNLGDASASRLGRHPALRGEQVFIPTDNGYLRFRTGSLDRIDVTDPLFAERRSTQSNFRATPAFWQDEVILVDTEGTIFRYDPRRGRIIAGMESGLREITGMQPLVTGNRVFLADSRGNIVAVALPELEVLWRSSMEGGVFFQPVWTPLGIFAYSREARLVKRFDARSGENTENWGNVSAPPFWLEGFILIPNSTGGLDVANLELNWIHANIPFPDIISARPVRLENRIFLGSRRGNIYVLNIPRIIEEARANPRP